MNDMSTPRSALYSEMSGLHLTPLWEVLHALVPPQPRPAAVPCLWKYDDVRPFIERAGQLITAEEAIRRVLIFENPGLPGRSSVTGSLYAGLQLILPGEVAPAHRHTQSALRFIVEGSGAYTAVNGERTTMAPGDFIITPSWTWHDHGNEGNEPVVWLDGLDIPTVAFFDAGFAENSESTMQAVARPEGASAALHGANMAPMSHADRQPPGATSPLFTYPYARARESLASLARFAAADPCDGIKLRYTNPATGGWPMPTIATFLQRLPAGFRGRAYRQTDGAVFSVVEGAGRAVMTSDTGDTPTTHTFEFGPRDHFVVPSWTSLALEADEDAYLFSFSDRPAQQALGLWREDRNL
ncbi:MAG TPA: gentisate 1,2-dioxygenase [Casimicrobiaceae bacterium]|nr:gentisate 1,2-dioxygenase [Casimicrobiaceae bacterium]